MEKILWEGMEPANLVTLAHVIPLQYIPSFYIFFHRNKTPRLTSDQEEK